MKFDICVFFENLKRKFRFDYNVTETEGTLREDQYTFFVSSHSILLTIFQTKFVEKIKARFPLYYFENRAVCEIMWKSNIDPDRPQKTI